MIVLLIMIETGGANGFHTAFAVCVTTTVSRI